MSFFQNSAFQARTTDGPITVFHHFGDALAPAASMPIGDITRSVDEFDNRFKIRVVKDGSSRRRVSELIQDRYAWRGYESRPLEEEEATITLAAYSQDAIVSTLTARVDSPAGLYVEKLYPDVVKNFRDQGRRLCEFTKLAIDPSVKSHAIFAKLLHIAHLYVFELHGCTDMLCEVNPRHVLFYERMMGFTKAAGVRQDAEVQAPAELLHLDLFHCATEAARVGGGRTKDAGKRSLYPQFLPAEEAINVSRRLRQYA